MTTTKNYRWEGPYYRGAMRQYRASKRAAAILRNLATPAVNRRVNRLA